jgi:AAA15 family ATPase/GTPase
VNSIVRIKSVILKNIKNVKFGEFNTNSSFEMLSKADIVGFYGQNGSGKTAVVNAFNLLKILLLSQSLPDIKDYLLSYGEDTLRIEIDFIAKNEYGKFTIKYECDLVNGEELIEGETKRLKVVNESLKYKENESRRRFKELISKKNNEILLRMNPINSTEVDTRVGVLAALKYSEDKATSFVFRPELIKLYNKFFNDIECKLMENLVWHFSKDFHVINNIQNGFIIANILMPFSIHIKQVRGQIPYELKDNMLLSTKAFNTISNVIEQINVVLDKLVPNLQISVNEIHRETMENGEDGIKFEFLSNKNGVKLPLKCESDGILKLISILSTLIAVFNNENACVVIDELDSGIFEYLLGEILEVISLSGKGQLFFTSHNLRILEVLSNEDLRFTTVNELNRFIKLKGIRETNNVRDIYLRALQLDGQNERLYEETDLYDIKKSFRKAGELNV